MNRPPIGPEIHVGRSPGEGERVIAEFAVPSEPGQERLVMERVARAVRDLPLPDRRHQQLATAVSEATMNAIEHGNRNNPDLSVGVRVITSDLSLRIEILDHGAGTAIPDEPERPDIEAKLEGRQSPRGWGLFLIENMVDEMRTSSNDTHHLIELVMRFEDSDDG
jgi:anti-sigma regulatory factor (Ser/Thr protein kinase)